MAYRRSTSRRRSASGRGRSVSGYSRVRSSSRVSRLSPARRRSSAGGTRTVRLVIEQAAPSVGAPVVTEDGRFAVPDRTQPKRAKF